MPALDYGNPLQQFKSDLMNALSKKVDNWILSDISADTVLCSQGEIINPDVCLCIVAKGNVESTVSSFCHSIKAMKRYNGYRVVYAVSFDCVYISLSKK